MPSTTRAISMPLESWTRMRREMRNTERGMKGFILEYGWIAVMEGGSLVCGYIHSAPGLISNKPASSIPFFPFAYLRFKGMIFFFGKQEVEAFFTPNVYEVLAVRPNGSIEQYNSKTKMSSDDEI